MHVHIPCWYQAVLIFQSANDWLYGGITIDFLFVLNDCVCVCGGGGVYTYTCISILELCMCLCCVCFPLRSITCMVIQHISVHIFSHRVFHFFKIFIYSDQTCINHLF